MTDDTSQLSQTLAASRNVLGYTLKERIGAGGFGEVWSAEAPGGLMKAVKFVFGYHDEKRAQAELKALDRVKELRHPFLLSLERIEVFEGQLVVVSELADKSMADLFNEFAIKGEQGIPRDQLLKFMRDAADALDYMSNEHSLQHLDVKPENLLVVGTHVKVADFGLIKDLHKASMSLMSGMTPSYAAPELFDGRPGTRSDQYSLAIVYQEMLTAIRPFPGTTPAQLAAQHLHGKPNLRPLPKDDQPIIARALSKDPGVRFNTCLEMVEELLNRKRTAKKSIRRIQAPTRTASESDSATMMVSGEASPDVTQLVESAGLPFQANEIQTLDPPDCDPAQATARPALIVGVGATGNRIVHRIKQQLEARHGSMEAVPAVKLLAIDSDDAAISNLCRIGEPGSLDSSETIQTLLKKPEFYRDQANNLSWLSRRWIYNIPRSLQTEGLRPLGRLLFASYFDLLYERVQQSIDQIVKAENLATTADTLDLNPGDPQPRVFVVSSISGGIGSGMSLDLAYTIKLLMAERGLATDSVTGMLLHSSYQRTRDPGLAAANAFAFMTELRHFVEYGYPGDATLGIPDFEGEHPFDHTYYRALGNDLSQTEYDSKLSSLAEYIYLSALSPCSVFLDACRGLDREREHFALRTCGLSVSGPGNQESGRQAVNQVSSGLIQRWISGDPDTETDAQQFVREVFEQKRLTEESCVEDVTQRVHSVVEGSLESIATGATDIVMRANGNAAVELTSYLDGAFGCPPDRQGEEYQEPEICLQMSEQIGTQSMIVGDEVCNAILSLLKREQLELSTANAARDACRFQFERLVQRLETKALEIQQGSSELFSLLSGLSGGKGRIHADSREAVMEIVNQYCAIRMQEFVLRYACRFYQSCQSTLVYAAERVDQFKRQLEMIANEFLQTDESSLGFSDDRFSMDRLLAESIERELPQQIGRTEVQVYESLIRERGGYLDALSEQGCWHQRLPGAIRTAAQQVLADAYKKISLEEVIATNDLRIEQLVKWLTEKMNQAKPEVNDCGGASRVMVAMPALADEQLSLPEIIQSQFSVPSKSIKGTRGNIVLCFEGEDVSLASVAYRLLEARPDAIDLVKRLHTRNDVQWSTLNDLL